MADEFKHDIGLFTFYKLQENQQLLEQARNNTNLVSRPKNTREGIRQKIRKVSSLFKKQTEPSGQFVSNHDRYKVSEQFLKNIPHKLHKHHDDRLNQMEKSLIVPIHLKTEPSIMLQKRANIRVTVIDQVISPDSIALKPFEKGESIFFQRMQLLHPSQVNLITSRKRNQNEFALHSIEFMKKVKDRDKEELNLRMFEAQMASKLNNSKELENKRSQTMKRQRTQISPKSFIEKIKFLQDRSKKELVTLQANSLAASKTSHYLNQVNKRYLSLLIQARPDGRQTATRILRETLKFPKINEESDASVAIRTEGSSHLLKLPQRQNNSRSLSCSKKEINIRQFFQKKRQYFSSKNQKPMFEPNIYRKGRKNQKISRH